MTVGRLTLVASLCMLVTGLAVYAWTDPPAREPPPPPSAGTSADAPQARAEPPALASAPAAPSEPPTAAEWASAPLVSLEGGAGHPCTAKMARDWLRVSCEEKDDTGGRPVDIRVAGGRPLEKRTGTKGISHAAWKTPSGVVYTAVGDTLMSLVCRLVDGLRVEARFEWTDRSADLHVRQAPGAAVPAARFEPL